MNAALLERLVLFREQHGLETAETFLGQKIRYQYATLKRRKRALPFLQEIYTTKTVLALLLVEARAAKEYWRAYGKNIAGHAAWHSRKPHAPDPCNQLLDIGYHYLTGYLSKLFAELNIPTELGLFHRAQSAKAHPLVYDFMEWLRPLLVDRVILVFFKKKKRVLQRITGREVGLVIVRIKKELERRYYHKKLDYCITLTYWIKLIALELEKSIRHNTAFEPIFPSLRHETRCKKPRLHTQNGAKD